MKKKILTLFIIFNGVATIANAQKIDSSELLKLTNLKIYKSVQHGYWVHTTRYEPESPELKPGKEEGCVSKQEMAGLFKPATGENNILVCDINVREDGSNRALVSMCDKTFKGHEIMLDMRKITDNHYTVTVDTQKNFKIISEYRRTGACKAG